MLTAMLPTPPLAPGDDHFAAVGRNLMFLQGIDA